MAEHLLEYLWLLASFPFLTLFFKIRLHLKSKDDYANYIDNLSFRAVVPSASKFCFFFTISAVSFFFIQNEQLLNITMALLALTSTLLESLWLIGRPHYLPGYKPNFACEKCRVNLHSECSNLRALENVNKIAFARENIFTPVCCCGFVLSRRVLDLRLRNL